MDEAVRKKWHSNGNNEFSTCIPKAHHNQKRDGHVENLDQTDPTVIVTLQHNQKLNIIEVCQ